MPETPPRNEAAPAAALDPSTWDGLIHFILRFDTPLGPTHTVHAIRVMGEPLEMNAPMPATVTAIDSYYDSHSAWAAADIYQGAAYAQFKKAMN